MKKVMVKKDWTLRQRKMESKEIESQSCCSPPLFIWFGAPNVCHFKLKPLHYMCYVALYP